MIILGINGIEGLFHDSSATIIKDNKIISSVEEERFNRKKHTNGIPFNAINFCLKKARANFGEIDHIGYYLDPMVLKKVFVDDVVARFNCSPKGLKYYVDVANRINNVEQTLKQNFSFSNKTKFHYVNHHIAHASSAYYISGFDESAILTIDGSGDRETSALYHAKGTKISKVRDFLVYPESLGFIYTVMANQLGLGWIEGPGKLMGLAGYGTPDTSLFDDIVSLKNDPTRPVEINMTYFDYHTGGTGLTKKGKKRFGSARKSNKKLTKEHFDLAASVQQMLEGAIMHIVRYIPELIPGVKNLCFSGGVALNVRANRLILDSKLFDGFFVTPPAYDGGTSLGCALYLNTLYSGVYQYDFNPYCGPIIDQDFLSVESSLERFREHVNWELLDEDQACHKAAEYIKMNKIIGWARGAMECGPRALGNRSILTNAMNPSAKEELNSRVKKRESFRPYAPSVLAEECNKWFDLDVLSPFMLLEAYVLEDKRKIIPGVVHVDGTSRIQTVDPTDNSAYYKLIKEFSYMTGVPLVLNTSFNRHGEPIVNTPEEAIRVLLETDMDALFVGNYHITKKNLENILHSNGGSRSSAIKLE